MSGFPSSSRDFGPPRRTRDGHPAASLVGDRGDRRHPRRVRRDRRRDGCKGGSGISLAVVGKDPAQLEAAQPDAYRMFDFLTRSQGFVLSYVRVARARGRRHSIQGRAALGMARAVAPASVGDPRAAPVSHLRYGRRTAAGPADDLRTHRRSRRGRGAPPRSWPVPGRGPRVHRSDRRRYLTEAGSRVPNVVDRVRERAHGQGAGTRMAGAHWYRRALWGRAGRR